MKSIVEGMRSGKSFSATGDLINALDFSIQSTESMKEMGGELEVAAGDEMELKIRFKSPNQNNNGDPVQVDHVDLIVGNVTGPVEPEPGLQQGYQRHNQGPEALHKRRLGDGCRGV